MLLHGYRLKLARASKHLETLEFEIGRFLRREPYALVRHLDVEASSQPGRELEYVYTGSVHERPPFEWNVLLGEMLHNWRSGLDALAWQLAIGPNGEDPPTGTGFPIFDKKAAFYAEDTDTGEFSQWSGAYKIRGIPAEGARRIIEDEQPHTRGNEAKNDALWLLHELANDDKHSIVQQLAPSISNAEFLPSGGAKIYPLDVRLGAFEDGDEIARIRVDFPSGKANVKVRVARDVSLSKEGPAAGQPLLPLLWKIAGAVVDRIAIPLEPFTNAAAERKLASEK